MTDEAESRARIEARVAARRSGTWLFAKRPLPGQDPSPDETEPPGRSPQPRPTLDVWPEKRPNLTKPSAAPSPTTAGPDRPRPRPRPTVFSPDSAGRSRSEPDLNRGLTASEPQKGDDEPDDVLRKPSALSAFWKRWRRGLVKLVVLAAVAVVAATLLRIFVLAPYYIPSESMEPTLHGCTGCDNDHVLVDKISYRFHDPRQSDIVVFDKPKGVVVPEGEDVLIKRVIALPGDTIAIKKGRVIVNGAVLKESYLNKDKSCYPSTNMATRTVPANRVFVMGDNRCNSTDSRVFGTIPESAIVGRAWLIIWPLKRIGTL